MALVLVRHSLGRVVRFFRDRPLRGQSLDEGAARSAANSALGRAPPRRIPCLLALVPAGPSAAAAQELVPGMTYEELGSVSLATGFSVRCGNQFEVAK